VFKRADRQHVTGAVIEPDALAQIMQPLRSLHRGTSEFQQWEAASEVRPDTAIQFRNAADYVDRIPKAALRGKTSIGRREHGKRTFSIKKVFNRHSSDSRRFRGQDRASDRLGQRQIATASATGDRSTLLTAAER